MGKLNKSTKVKIKRDRILKDYNRILSWMDFKMRWRYNSGELSRYLPNKNELEVIRICLNDVTDSDIIIGKFDFAMFLSILDDINRETVPSTGYNKRALIAVINSIRDLWLYKYPEIVTKKG